MLPILVEGPGALVTADTHYLVDAIQDLAAGDLSGFNQNLQLIPATNIALLVFAAGIPAVAAVAILTGQDFLTSTRESCGKVELLGLVEIRSV